MEKPTQLNCIYNQELQVIMADRLRRGAPFQDRLLGMDVGETRLRAK
jgi:hypothetical protein